MNILEKTLAFISLLLLILCALAPLKRTGLAQKRPWIRHVTGFHTAYGIALLITGLIHGALAGNAPAMMAAQSMGCLALI